ncbi:MAG TPA: hypothetical protein VGY50_02985 [Streptosporangiaceae bacterium]|nr:hypothetical protein [Streptosporangiaceae bacterium]
MFGHKSAAEAVVIAREKLHESPVEHGSNYHHWHYQTWRFVLDVRPEGALAHRAAAEQKIRIPDFVVPAVGSTVRAEFDDKHPGQVELVLNGDDRYDMALSNREEREQEKAGKASRDAAFQAALDAPPGTPQADGQPGAHGDGTRAF